MQERLARSDGYHNEGTGLVEVDHHLYVPEERLAQQQRLQGRYLLATPDERDNWGMWLLITLPTVVHYLRNADRYDGVICYVERPWQRRFLLACGLPESVLVPHRIDVCYSVEHLEWIGRGIRNLSVTPWDLSLIHI